MPARNTRAVDKAEVKPGTPEPYVGMKAENSRAFRNIQKPGTPVLLV